MIMRVIFKSIDITENELGTKQITVNYTPPAPLDFITRNTLTIIPPKTNPTEV